MGLLKYDEMDSEDSRSVHRYWTWGSCIPHVTPPHAQRNPQSPSVRLSLWFFSSQECSEFTNRMVNMAPRPAGNTLALLCHLLTSNKTAL